MAFTLKYADLSATPKAIQIYFGQPAENGGIIVELCGADTAPCPASPGVLTGTIIADDLKGVTAQGIAPKDFTAFLEVIRHGKAFINVVTIDKFKPGEILGAIEEENNGRGHFDRARWHGHQGGGPGDDGGRH
jgi:hypothetical protein